ncbi:hypothetical protein B0H10DRAFT_1803078 [Mycena sp. CBHHK59/15]|nr:hypothetical protein B0H10DRAFT_1803078 [Mycena sp. CBHHK59/15]
MMSETVIREVTENVWTFSRPFTVGGFLPVGGRSVAIKLSNGGVLLVASTPLDAETKQKVDKLGPVQYIIGSNAAHYLFLGEYKRAYPNAKLLAPEDAVSKPATKSLKFDGIWGRDAPNTVYGFEEDVSRTTITISRYFPGRANKDVVFFHPASRTLIQADLVFNLPCTEQARSPFYIHYSKSKSSGKTLFAGAFKPSWLQSKLTSLLVQDKAAMKRDIATVMKWDFDRIIPCHGDVIERDGKSAFSLVFKTYLS